MMLRNFDKQFEATQRRIARAHRIIAVMIVAFWIGIVIAGVWLFQHPEAIGAFFGKIAAGFNGATR